MPPPPSPPSSAPLTQPEAVEVVASARTDERRAFGFLALAALAALLRLAMPVWVGLFLGALLAFALEPLFGWLRKKQVTPGTAALLCALGAAAIVSSAVFAVTTLLITRGLVLLMILRTQLAPGGAARVYAENVLARLSSLHIVNTADVLQRIESEAVSLASSAAGITAEVAGVTFDGLLTLFFVTLTAYFVLRQWESIVSRSERALPFERRHTRALMGQFRSVGREVLLGTVVTGLVQGVFAALGYWMTGVREPAFFGALTALASLVPGVGPLLIWVPVGVVQILTGHAGAGLVELAYSGLTVGIASDYIIRPRLVGREKGIPTIFMFIGLFGGVSVFGIIGLILGPVIVTLSLAVLRTYEREAGEGLVAMRRGP